MNTNLLERERVHTRAFYPNDVPNASLGNMAENLCGSDNDWDIQREVVKQFPARETPQSVRIVFLVLTR